MLFHNFSSKTSKIEFTPKFGEYLSSRNGSETKILLIDTYLEYGTLGQGSTTGPPVCPITAKEGDPCVIIYGTVKNEYDRDYFVCISADVYNLKGEKVGQIVDAPECAYTVTHISSNDTGNFKLHIKYDKKDVACYELFAIVCGTTPPE